MCYGMAGFWYRCFESIDKVNGRLKALTMKNKERQNLFCEIGKPSSVMFTI